MGEALRLADLLQQAYDGEQGSPSAWHGPSISLLLRDVTDAEAARVLAPGMHSVAELVLHMAFWDEVCVRRLSGEELMVTTGSPEDWPACPALDADTWRAILRRSQAARASLVAKVRSLSDPDLQTLVAGWGWSYGLMIHGTLHHDLYHAGQIALIAAAVRRAPPPPA